MPAFDDGMNKAALVAASQDVLGFLTVYLAVIVRFFFDKYILTEANHYLRFHWIVAIFENISAGAWTQSQCCRAIDNLLGLIKGDQAGAARLFAVEISHPSDQSSDQWYLCPPGLEDIVSENPLPVSTVQPEQSQ